MSKKFWFLVSGSILFIIATLFINWHLLQSVAIQNRGSYGDLFGFANTLFSGLAFVGVIAAILIQSEELKLQRNELQETREEFQQQNNTLKKQAFENTFFQIQNSKNEILKNLHSHKYGSQGAIILSHEAQDCRNRIRSLVQSHQSKEQIKTTLENNSNFIFYLEQVYEHFAQIIKCHINLEFLIETTRLISIEEKSFYEQLVLNQLTESEFFFFYLFKLLEIPSDPKISKLLIRQDIFQDIQKTIFFEELHVFATSY